MAVDKNGKDLLTPKEKLQPFSVSSARKPVRRTRTISFTIPPLPNIPRSPFNKRSTSITYGLLVALFVIATLLSGFAGGWIEARMNQNGLVTTSLSNQKQIVTSDSELISQIAKTVSPSVVSVNVNITNNSPTSSYGGFGLFGFSQPAQEQAAGTGIIISSKGIIMTNRHVVPDGTTSVSVTLSDGTELKDVSVIGRTNASDSLDVAFLKINNTQGHKLIPAVLGNSSQVQVGNSVVAIGNALGQFQNTITSGIISGYGRDIQAGSSSATENLEDLFQTDAAINEGNSGGPLVNLNGQVIGMNTATASSGQNIGFSIPVNDVLGLIGQVVKTGKFSQPYIGVRYIPLTADVSVEYNLSVNNGAFIAPSADPVNNPSVVPGSPAAQAGLQENDIITQVNGANVNQNNSLTSLLDNYLPGKTITLAVFRSGHTIHVNVVLGTAPGS
ncbi:MAG TPA: trypsin-like peptidase domain-containing protein [Candidatus Dormibacteraeota bacterium]|nr:trypsin-like peptidase domain-containing protein [Candidatus Dormibacteraeota bacterium]